MMTGLAASRLHSLFEERLEELYEQSGLTQKEVAHRIGATDQQVSQWLRAPRNMTVRSAGRLMGGMGAQLVFDIERDEHKVGGNAPPAQANSAGPATSTNPINFNIQGPLVTTKVDA